MQLSSIVGTIILSPEGENLGYVKEALLTRDLGALSCLIAVDGEEEEFFLPARAVLAVKDAVIAGKARLNAPTGIAAPMGRAVFSEDGEFLGTVTDVTTGGPPKLTVQKHGAAASDIPLSHAAVGETVIVFREARKKRAPSRKSAKKAPEEPQKPANAIAFNRFNLLGRRVKKSVFDAFGSPVALAGERVTPEMLAAARRQNCLLALTVNTLTNVL